MNLFDGESQNVSRRTKMDEIGVWMIRVANEEYMRAEKRKEKQDKCREREREIRSMTDSWLSISR